MPNRTDLSLVVTHSDGTSTRWGPDELDAGNVPADLRFSTSQPGGFRDLTTSLLRDLRYDRPDQALFDTVTVYGPGQQVVWQGRMQQFPASHAGDFSITPGAVGWAAHLRDDTSFREIYVDRDLSNWGEPGDTRKGGLLTTSYKPTGAQTNNDDGTGAALLLAIDNGKPWTTDGKPMVEAWYGKGVPIGSVYYAWQRVGTKIDNADTNWIWGVTASDDDRATTTDTTGSLRAAGPSTGTLTTTGTKKYALVQLYYSTSGGIDSYVYPLSFTCLAVYGTHGLTKQGTASATAAQGLLASDMVANIVGRAAPLLKYTTTGPNPSIQATSFVIPQAVFSDPTTAEDAVSAVNAYHAFDWGVWEDRLFYFQQPSQSTVWEARLSDGAEVTLEGDDATSVVNGVVVSYQDALTGRTKTVGPPGSSCDDTDASLADTSATNPVNAHGIPAKYGSLSLSTVTTLAGAVQIGAVWLAEASLAGRRGTINLTGEARHPTKGMRPVYEIRAGDCVRIADRPGDTVVRKIIQTDYTHSTRSCVLSCDNTSHKLEAILERIGVLTVGQV